MLIEPNLPSSKVKKAIVSKEITSKMRETLEGFGIELITLGGKLNCDIAVRNHPDIYVTHLSGNRLLLVKNICSIMGDIGEHVKNMNISLSSLNEPIDYAREVFFNCAVIGRDLIVNPRYIHPEIMQFAKETEKRVISVKQGYTKCNICVVDKKSIITEDKGIYKTLSRYGYDVLLLENNFVKLKGHEYGFIGGASGKISKDKLAFYGCIEEHPEFSKIKDFLDERAIEAISLSAEPLTDFGSLIPIEQY